MIQTFQITADIPEGYEPTGEFRPPIESAGEEFVGYDGTRCRGTAIDNPPTASHRIILRKKWEAPKCFPDGVWVYKSSACNNYPGHWYVVPATHQPHPYGDGSYTTCMGSCDTISAAALAELHGEKFTPPAQNLVQVRRNDGGKQTGDS